MKLFFLTILLVISLCNACFADKIYKDSNLGIDFKIPISDITDESGKVWGILTRDKISPHISKINSESIEKYREKFKNNNLNRIAFVLLSINEENKIEDSILVKCNKNVTDMDLCVYEEPAIRGFLIANAEVNEAIRAGFNANHTFCGLKIYSGPIARRKCFELTLSNGTQYFCVSAAGRLGKQIELYGYVSKLETLKIVKNKMNSILSGVDFDATFEKGYFEIELQDI